MSRPDRAWRYVRFAEPRGPWRPTAEAALLDALEDGQATEAWWPPHPITVTWPGSIERTVETVDVEVRPMKRHRRRFERA